MRRPASRYLLDPTLCKLFAQRGLDGRVKSAFLARLLTLGGDERLTLFGKREDLVADLLSFRDTFFHLDPTLRLGHFLQRFRQILRLYVLELCFSFFYVLDKVVNIALFVQRLVQGPVGTSRIRGRVGHRRFGRGYTGRPCVP